jgi:dipeptidyl aminopeptidase/acylaminoacyl peptidase
MITRILLFILIAVIYANANANANEIDYKSFGHLPMVEHPTVSPNGKHIVAVYNSESGPLVVVSDFGSQEITTVAKLNKAQDRIEELTWANNERVVISASYSEKILGDRYRVNRLFSVNKDGSNLLLINRKEIRKGNALRAKTKPSRIVSLLRGDKENLLIQIFDEKDQGWSVFKVNIYTNSFEKLFANKFDVNNWFANAKGEVVFGVGIEKDLTTIWYREDNSQKWKKLHSKKAYQGSTFNPVLVKGDKAVVITDHKLGRQALWLYNIKTDEFEKELYANEKFDVKTAILNPLGTEVIGAVYFEHYKRNFFFNDNDKSVFSLVKNSFKKYQTTIVDFSLDRKQVLVLAESDISPPKYFWLDLQKKKGGLWFSAYPHLENKKLVSVIPFDFEARDGKNLNGYLTLPYANKKPALVVFPHGGPQARDYQYFNPYVQYFASLGYAVLQVNFRGSTGFGNQHETDGYREWGNKMQNDIYDAVYWLDEKNLVNTKDSCIVGASYGGYVALTSAFQKPDLFKCTVSLAGISDLPALVEDEYKYPTLRAFVRKTIGDPKDTTDLVNMNNLSLINNIDKVKSPILLVHGTYDTQVNFSQSEQLYDKANAEGKDIQYLEIAKATHYFDNNENRLTVFKTVGEFLNKHLN